MVPDRCGVEQHLADELLGHWNSVGGVFTADRSRFRLGSERQAMLIDLLLQALISAPPRSRWS